MRISDRTAEILIKLAKVHFGDAAQVRLFGSRVDDQAKGGDIDIQIIAPESSYRDEISFLVAVEKELDERVDVRVQRVSKLLIDDLAIRKGVLLHGQQ